MAQRIQVAAEHRMACSGMAFFVVYDSVDMAPLCRHSFELGEGSHAWIEHNRRVAQSLADALNGAPAYAIEHVRQVQRTADLVEMRINNRAMPLSLAA